MTRTLSALPDDRHRSLYQALRSRDRRFDGTFFVGVGTTGIYCRPVCRARLPLARNCTFFRTAAEAERRGYRPCLRCRPELAPGRALADAQSRLAQAAWSRIAAGALNDGGMAALARDLCVGERHLRRVVAAEFGANPVELAQTQRLLLAKQLLTETDLPITRIAFVSGFASVSRFNALFQQRYRMSPTRLRRARATAPQTTGTIRLLFGYRAPYAWSEMLRFLAGRTVRDVERVSDVAYTRSVRIGAHAGWIRVTRENHVDALAVEISESLLPALVPLRAAVRRAFDLDAEPDVIEQHFRHDPLIGPRVRACPGLRLPGGIDAFELAVRGVLGQQVSVAAATTVAGRLAAAFGDTITGPPGVSRLMPTAAQLAVTDATAVAALGMPLSRARTVVLLARGVAEGTLDLSPGIDITATTAALCAIPGIGAWTAQYIAMRALHWPDAFPAGDLGVKRALGTSPAAVADAWRPWRAYATMYLWHVPVNGGA